jgi:hypothetical protein
LCRMVRVVEKDRLREAVRGNWLFSILVLAICIWFRSSPNRFRMLSSLNRFRMLISPSRFRFGMRPSSV